MHLHGTQGDHIHKPGAFRRVNRADYLNRQDNHSDYKPACEAMDPDSRNIFATDDLSDENPGQVCSTSPPQFPVKDREHSGLGNMLRDHEERRNDSDIDSLLSYSDGEESSISEPLRPQRTRTLGDSDLLDSEGEDDEARGGERHFSEAETWVKGGYSSGEGNGVTVGRHLQGLRMRSYSDEEDEGSGDKS